MSYSRQSSVSSPCISLCALDDKDICIGCYRSSKEIRDWMLLDDDERLEVLELAGERARKKNPFA